jgi:hypothetical protein
MATMVGSLATMRLKLMLRARHRRSPSRLVVEGRQRADHTDHDRHRVRVATEALVELGHLLVHHRVLLDGVLSNSVFCLAFGSSPFFSR